jgi:PD-(D/E)XK nuclease superfamily
VSICVNSWLRLGNYLRITKLRVGVIFNFKHAKLEWERIVL